MNWAGPAWVGRDAGTRDATGSAFRAETSRIDPRDGPDRLELSRREPGREPGSRREAGRDDRWDGPGQAGTGQNETDEYIPVE